MASPASTSPNQLVPNSPTGEIEEIEDTIDQQFKSFKNFDVLTNPPSDHHFLNSPPSSGAADYMCASFVSVKKSSKTENALLLQQRMFSEEWELLMNNLPNSIFVRAYSRRVDLMRVAIIGLDRRCNGDIDDKENVDGNSNTNPYSYGLFFFDVYFPPQYPVKPPSVSHVFHGGVSLEWHSSRFFIEYNRRRSFIHGLPIISSCLGSYRTSTKSSSEGKWDPVKSNVLEVLRFIQNHVLQGPENIQRANEIFVVSHKAMISILRSPPRGFEGFVRGYFRKYSHVILDRFRNFLAMERERLARSGSMGSTSTASIRSSRLTTFEVLLKTFEDNGSYCLHINVHS